MVEMVSYAPYAYFFISTGSGVLLPTGTRIRELGYWYWDHVSLTLVSCVKKYWYCQTGLRLLRACEGLEAGAIRSNFQQLKCEVQMVPGIHSNDKNTNTTNPVRVVQALHSIKLVLRFPSIVHLP